MVNSADVPSVRAMPDGTLAAHWMVENGPDPEAYDLRLAWSADGSTWSAPVAPNRDKTISQHGFASLFPTAGGGTGPRLAGRPDDTWRGRRHAAARGDVRQARTSRCPTR